jgi:hypothetical protein
MLCKLLKRLNKSELEQTRSFINENAHLDNSAFELKLNRLFLDKQAHEKPPHYREMLELLSNANSISRREKSCT